MGSKSTYIRNQLSVKDQKLAKSLRAQIKLLRDLPGSYRDIPRGDTAAWMAWQKLFPEQVEEMETWRHGPILVYHPLTDMERALLAKYHQIVDICLAEENDDVFEARSYKWTEWNELEGTLAMAVEEGCSFIYLKNEPLWEIETLNKLFSHLNLAVRCKAEIVDDNGNTIGL